MSLPYIIIIVAGPQNELVEHGLIDLSKQFKCVHSNLIEVIIRNDLSVKVLKTSLMKLPPSVRERNKELMDDGVKLMEASTVEVFMFHLNKYLHFLDPCLLQQIVEDHGDDKTKQLMVEYNEHLTSFRHETKLCDFIGICDGDTPAGYKELEIGLDDVWRDKTLEDFERMRSVLSRQYWLFKKVRPGSIVVVYSIPESEHIELTGLKEFLISQSVLWIKDDKEYIFDQKAEQVMRL